MPTLAKPISLSNAVALSATLADTEHRATARTLSAQDLTDAATETERKLRDAGVPVAYWNGVTVYVNPHRVSNSARGSMATKARLQRRATSWVLTYVARDYCDHRSYGGNTDLATAINLTVAETDWSPLLESILRKHKITVSPRSE